MRRRGAGSESDSTELMLDAICNVFGGIILMAILVVIQTQTAAGLVDFASKETARLKLEDRKLEHQIGRRKKELGAKTTDKKRLEGIRGHDDAVAALEKLNAEIENQKKKNAKLQKEYDDLVRKYATMDKGGDTVPDGPDLAKEIAEREKRIKDLEKELAERKKPEPVRGREPKRKPAPAGIEVRHYVVKGFRAYRMGRLTGSDILAGKPFQAGECRVAGSIGSGGITIKIRPITTAGVDVPSDGSAPTAFLKTLADSTPQSHMVQFLVYGDSSSFAAFRILRDAVDRPAPGEKQGFFYDVVTERPKSGWLHLHAGGGQVTTQ